MMRRWPSWIPSRTCAIAIALLGALGVVQCGYVKLPGGLTINFPGFSGKPMYASELSQRVVVPGGFFLNAYAGGIENARLLRFTLAGDLLVSSPRTGTVWLIQRDADGDGVSDGQRVLLSNLYQPHGLALHDGWLYIAETTAVARVRFDAATGTVSGTPERIITGLPDGGNHWTRTVDVGPDGKLYVAVGSSCNVCIEADKRRAAILRHELDGSGGQIFATGLRNAVDFEWQPGTNALFATDNGRDLLGDDFPPCEFNRVVEGGFYGWPFANGDRIPDPDLGTGRQAQIAASIPPVHGFGAHTAPLGMTFYRRPAGAAPVAFPPEYDGIAFVALHGSWNRSKKAGYEVVALRFAADGSISEHPFVTGFLRNERVYGRPVDVAVGPDGGLYVSDDFTGQIYRVAYGAAARGDASRVPAPHGDPLAGLDAATVDQAAARGAALWQANDCARCHVAGQAAGDAYKPLQGLPARFTIASLVALLRTPPSPMPVSDLTEEQRHDLAVYLLRTHR